MEKGRKRVGIYKSKNAVIYKRKFEKSKYSSGSDCRKQ